MDSEEQTKKELADARLAFFGEHILKMFNIKAEKWKKVVSVKLNRVRITFPFIISFFNH